VRVERRGAHHSAQAAGPAHAKRVGRRTHRAQCVYREGRTHARCSRSGRELAASRGKPEATLGSDAWRLQVSPPSAVCCSCARVWSSQRGCLQDVPQLLAEEPCLAGLISQAMPGARAHAHIHARACACTHKQHSLPGLMSWAMPSAALPAVRPRTVSRPQTSCSWTSRRAS